MLEDNLKSMPKIIYYRGYLKSCNYTCTYCPFAKKSATKSDQLKDQETLLRFYQVIKHMKSLETIFFVPYGEAMFYPYYHDVLAKISKFSNIKRVSIQTNFSFSVEELLDTFRQNEANHSKIYFWLSYHEGQADLDEFLRKCYALMQAGIRYCAGSVADYKNIRKLAYLKENLPPNTYFWLNAIEGMGVHYNYQEIESFTKIDPMFPFEIKRIKANFEQCEGGKNSVFVKWTGDMYACNLSKISMGNLYQGTWDIKPCKCSVCSCYLAYSCRTDLHKLSDWMGENKVIRLPI